MLFINTDMVCRFVKPCLRLPVPELIGLRDMAQVLGDIQDALSGLTVVGSFVC